MVSAIINNVKRGYTPLETDRYQLQNVKQIGRKWKVKPKIFFKNFEKTLDKARPMCYNKGTR